MSKEALIEQARAKYRKEQLIAQAKQKWAQQNPMPASNAPSELPQQIETGARGFLEGATLGLSEPVLSGINAAIGTAMDAVIDKDAGQLSIENLKEEYSRDVARRRKLKEDFQGSDIAGQVVGAFSPGTIAAKAATVGGKLAKAALPKVISKIPVAGKIAGAGAEAAGMALGQEVPQSVVEGSTGFRTSEEQPSLAESAKGGAIAGATLNAAGQLAHGGGKLALGSLSALAGNVDPQTMKKYMDWKRAGGEAIDAVTAKGRVDDAVEYVRQQSQGMKGDFADAAVDAVGRLKQRVIQGSEEAYQILERTPGVIPSDTLKVSIDQAKRQVVGPAGVAIGPTTKAAVQQLDALARDVSKLPKQIDLVTAKSILQRLDDNISYSNRAGEFGSVGSNAFKSIRRNLDEVVKSISPAYADKMQDVAQATKSLDNISRQFGSVENAQRQIPSLIAGKDLVKQEAVKYLDRTTGSKLGSMMDEIQKREIINSMRPGQTEGFLKRIIGQRSQENKKQLAMLAQMSDQDLVKMADDFAMSTVFDREFRAGSQHVNFWTVLGGITLGSVLDQGALGMGGGAVLGVLTTKYGPRATRALLDGVVKMQGMPTFRKIDQMSNLPEPMRRELKMGLLRSINTFNDYVPVRIPDDQVVFVQGDIRSSDALTPMEKARAMDQLARNEGIDQAVLRKMVVSEDRATPRMQVKGSLPAEPMMGTGNAAIQR